MTPKWTDVGPDSFTISQGAPLVARLFGIPFAAAGAWFLYQFADGALHPSEMTIAGWIMLPLVTAAFLVPGWILLFGRKRTRIHASLREATEEFDLLVYTRRVTTRIPREAHVLLRYEAAGKSTNVYHTHVYLVPSEDKRILLAMFGSAEKTAAMELGQRVARALGIDVQDRCFEGGEVTAGGVVVDRLGPEDAD